jgi:segregation and condensation protein B
VSEAGPETLPPAEREAEPRPSLLPAIRLAEALIFASADPVPTRQLATLLGDDSPDAEDILAALAEQTKTRGVHLVESAGGWIFRTAPDLAPHLARIVEKPRRLPRAAMETLATIAYHQPCTRADIEDRRGVALAQTTLEQLLDANLIRPAGHREVPGRPALWATTPEFLLRFGLRTLADLPRRDDILTGAPAIPPERSAPDGPVLQAPPEED